MRRALKAALLSGLVFPGLGQLICRSLAAGLILVFLATSGFLLLLIGVAIQAQTLVARLQPLLEGPPPDLATLLAAARPTGFLATAGFVLLAAAWLGGLVHAATLKDR